MAIERTLSIIKPDAVAKNVIGQIYARFEAAGLKVVAAKMVHLSRGEAEAFYAVHKARPFFNDLVSFMISGPVMIQALEGEGAIARNRELMGATDPKKAEKGTIRADFADSIDANAVHGSDAPETAAVEVAFFFPGMNVYSRLADCAGLLEGRRRKGRAASQDFNRCEPSRSRSRRTHGPRRGLGRKALPGDPVVSLGTSARRV